VWGIGYDNTAWVYTGGTGGPFLKSKLYFFQRVSYKYVRANHKDIQKEDCGLDWSPTSAANLRQQKAKGSKLDLDRVEFTLRDRVESNMTQSLLFIIRSSP